MSPRPYDILTHVTRFCNSVLDPSGCCEKKFWLKGIMQKAKYEKKG